MYGGSSTHIPLKVNTGGVIPVIFASSILAFPATLAPLIREDSRLGWLRRPIEQIAPGMPLHDLLYIARHHFLLLLLHGHHLQSG